MADKSIDQLNAAEKIYATDLFVLQQSGTAKKLTGQVLLNWLTAAADGHGGISDVAKLSTSGLVDTYRITMADTTTFDFAVTNGKGITSISKTSTSGLVDTYTITYNNGTTSKFTVTNGAKGDKGDNAYVWIKYASQKPTESSHSMGDLPDDWIGVYSGNSSTAPTDWTQYTWFKYKGEQGDKGDPATLVSTEIVYQSSDSGTIIPSGEWSTSIPVVAQGKYLWTREITKFNTGDPITKYSVSRMGLDGAGSVSSVCGVSPDSDGNVALVPADVGALPTTGGDLTGELRMNGQPISGLNDPTEDTQAARKGYVDKHLPLDGSKPMTGDLAMGGNKVAGLAAPSDNADGANKEYVDTSVRKAAPRNMLDNSDFTNLVAQAGIGGSHGSVAYAADRWILISGTVSYEAGVGLTLDGTIKQKLERSPETATPAVGMISGTAEISFEDGAVTITSSGGVLKWAALYEGAYTAATMPEYQPNGYWAELLECQRYYVKWGVVRKAGIISPYNTTKAVGFVFIREMRANPSIVFNNITAGSDKYPITSIVLSQMSPNMVELSIEGDFSSCVVYGAYTFRPSSGGYLELVADL